MKSMKSLSMNKMLGGIRRKGTASGPVAQSNDSPEQTAHDSVKAFCESGYNVQGDEVLFLPPIVDAAESSPAAAAECARMIRKFMSKEYYNRAAWQYNAIMLLRILTQNPGPMFTRYIDSKFVDACKSLLRGNKDLNVRQMLIETLEDFDKTKSYDENLTAMLQMWKKEKTKIQAVYGSAQMSAPATGPRPSMVNPSAPNQERSQSYFSRHHTNNKLPSPPELASRLEEARTSAKLLEQVVMNTPRDEILDSELVREFADRCLSASRSIQGYMVSTDPAPDNETMESLIDTNEQLQAALSQHQRSVLSARKQLGLHERPDETTPTETPTEGVSGESSALYTSHDKGKQTEVYSGSTSGSGSGSASRSNQGKKGRKDGENPFQDPFADGQSEGARCKGTGSNFREGTTGENVSGSEAFNFDFKSSSFEPSVGLRRSSKESFTDHIYDDDDDGSKSRRR